jgi:hypothetical protein
VKHVRQNPSFLKYKEAFKDRPPSRALKNSCNFFAVGVKRYCLQTSGNCFSVSGPGMKRKRTWARQWVLGKRLTYFRGRRMRIIRLPADISACFSFHFSLMKKLIILFAIGLLTQQVTQAQGTAYISSVGQPSTGYYFVASNKWEAAMFATGTNAGGYALNSIQLGMADVTGTPSGLTVMIYNQIPNSQGQPGFIPGSSLDTLDGSLNPTTAGTYTYTNNANITLLPSTVYYLVLTAGTAITNGTYDWSITDPSSYTTSVGWEVFNNPSGPGQGALFRYSTNSGSSWSFSYANLQYAITATAVPEPSPSLLLLLGSGIFIYVCKRRRYST